MSDSQQSRYSAAWEQFLVGRKQMLAEFDQAKEHSRHLPVQVQHGLVAEASFRSWLETFLPKRFGVTSGYIRAQRSRGPWNAHFDVIIYDQLNSPVLWVDNSKDKSEAGRARIIPAEFVHAVFEVKSSFSCASVSAAAEKLRQLEPLMSGFDNLGDPYPTYLPRNVVLGMLFFELKAEAAGDVRSLNLIRDLVTLNRPFYGAVILRAEELHENDTGVVKLLVADEAIELSNPPEGLIAGYQVSEALDIAGRFYRANIMWGDILFSEFAFDVLAIMTGTYRAGFTSSFHSIDFSKFPDSANKDRT